MNRHTVNGALLGVPEAAAYLGGSERWLQRRLNDHASGDHDDHSNSVCGVSVLVGQVHGHAVWMVDFSTGKILTEHESWK